MSSYFIGWAEPLFVLAIVLAAIVFILIALEFYVDDQ